MQPNHEATEGDDGATMRCLLLGHHWQLEDSRFVNPNRHDLGVRRIYYCARCLTRRSEGGYETRKAAVEGALKRD